MSLCGIIYLYTVLNVIHLIFGLKKSVMNAYVDLCSITELYQNLLQYVYCAW